MTALKSLKYLTVSANSFKCKKIECEIKSVINVRSIKENRIKSEFQNNFIKEFLEGYKVRAHPTLPDLSLQISHKR
jgi:hypothetical protein